MAYQVILKLLIIGVGFSFSQDYPDFEVVSFNNPYSKKILLHTMSDENRYIAIIDSNLDVQWSINSGHLGLDFKVNQNFLTYLKCLSYNFFYFIT